MGSFICDKCRTCSKFPFCSVTESKDGNCGEYIKRSIYTEVKRGDNEYVSDRNWFKRHDFTI